MNRAATPNPGDKRTEMAIRHCDSWIQMRQMLKGTEFEPRRIATYDDIRREKYMSFLAGFDAAMEMDHDELIDENRELQNRIMDLEFGFIDWMEGGPEKDFGVVHFDPIELGM